MREYKQKNRERLREQSRARYRASHPPVDRTGWTFDESGIRFCRSCLGRSKGKPKQGCQQPKHANEWEASKRRNNDYRRRIRAEARARGEIHQGGRGNLEIKMSRQRTTHQELRSIIFDRLGGPRCIWCGFSDPRALHFDHVNGGGGQHRRRVKTGTSYLRSLVDMPADQLRALLQVLCANCNSIKLHENQEWKRTDA